MMRKLSADEKMREEYLAREKAIMDYESSQYYIKTVLPKKAREEGLKEGIQKGIKEAAKKMLASGMNIKEIEKILGITENEFISM